MPTTTSDADTYDFIVTGAGSAGCAVAARLSESGRHRVLLLEAGVKDRNPWIHIPLGYAKNFTDPRGELDVRFRTRESNSTTASCTSRAARSSAAPVSINGMVYMRGNHADYDDWRQRGCTGWDWDSVLPYFKKAEDQARGPERIPRRRRPAARLRSAAALGTGGRAARRHHPGRHPAQRRLQRREAGGRGLLPDHHLQRAPLEHRGRLPETGPHATQPDRPDQGARHAPADREQPAVGVEFSDAGGGKTARARAEIVVSGGVYGFAATCCCCRASVRAQHLQAWASPCRATCRVGDNLHDHFNTYLPTIAASRSP